MKPPREYRLRIRRVKLDYLERPPLLSHITATNVRERLLHLRQELGQVVTGLTADIRTLRQGAGSGNSQAARSLEFEYEDLLFRASYIMHMLDAGLLEIRAYTGSDYEAPARARRYF